MDLSRNPTLPEVITRMLGEEAEAADDDHGADKEVGNDTNDGDIGATTVASSSPSWVPYPLVTPYARAPKPLSRKQRQWLRRPQIDAKEAAAIRLAEASTLAQFFGANQHTLLLLRGYLRVGGAAPSTAAAGRALFMWRRVSIMLESFLSALNRHAEEKETTRAGLNVAHKSEGDAAKDKKKKDGDKSLPKATGHLTEADAYNFAAALEREGLSSGSTSHQRSSDSVESKANEEDEDDKLLGIDSRDNARTDLSNINSVESARSFVKSLGEDADSMEVTKEMKHRLMQDEKSQGDDIKHAAEASKPLIPISEPLLFDVMALLMDVARRAHRAGKPYTRAGLPRDVNLTFLSTEASYLASYHGEMKDAVSERTVGATSELSMLAARIFLAEGNEIGGKNWIVSANLRGLMSKRDARNMAREYAEARSKGTMYAEGE